MSEKMVVEYRGDIIENIHRGDAVIIDGKKILYHLGNPRNLTHLRSSAKPLMMTSAVESGAIDRFGITERELAVLCSSHVADDYHVEAVLSVLKKIGLTEDDLDLYKDYSLSEKIRDRRVASGEQPRCVYNNCSGKHTCMLTLCRHFGWETKGYWKPDHPVQKYVKGYVSDFTEVPQEEIGMGFDGCGVPVFAIPLYNLAKGYFNLVHPDFNDELSENHKKSAKRIASAMAKYPEMLFGNGYFSTEIIRATKGKIIAKMGSNGVFVFCLSDRNICGALKIEDGNWTMAPYAVMECLNELNVLSLQEKELLDSFTHEDIINCHDIKAGLVRPEFTLSKGDLK